MTAKVYFLTARVYKWEYKNSLLGRFENLLKKMDFDKKIREGELIPIKTHFGSEGANQTIKPSFIRKIVEAVKAVSGKPFVTDSTRIQPYEYLEVANQNGYNAASLGAPVIIADGIFGNDSVTVKAGELLGEVCIPSAIYDAHSMIVISHFKGHIQAGIGGAIKNLAMGGVSYHPRGGDWKKGRGRMHFLIGDKMKWIKEKCNLCKTCVNICPTDAVSVEDEKIVVSDKDCWRCGRCSRVCPKEALIVPQTDILFHKSLAEGAKAVLDTFKDKKKILYINFLLDIQPECDCMSVCDVPVIQNIGILVGEDPVAIDKASLDLVMKEKTLPSSLAEGIEQTRDQDVFSILHKKNSKGHIQEAENLELGTQKYEIVES